MNKVVVHGRMVRDPEIRTAGSSQVCKFTVAENQRFDREKTNFHECEAWGKTAEFVDRYFRKGQEILVSGELKQQEWEAQDGSKRRGWIINVDLVDFCGKVSDNPTASSAGTGATTATSAPRYEELKTDDDLPF